MENEATPNCRMLFFNNGVSTARMEFSHGLGQTEKSSLRAYLFRTTDVTRHSLARCHPAAAAIAAEIGAATVRLDRAEQCPNLTPEAALTTPAGPKTDQVTGSRRALPGMSDRAEGDR
jgi:hypothetical protein